MEVRYQPSKANVTANELKRKYTCVIVFLLTQERRLSGELSIIQIEVMLPRD